MASVLGSIMRAATRKGPLNILTCPTHERTETNLCRTGHNFYAIRGSSVKDWNRTFAPLPANYTLLSPNEEHPIPMDLEIDLVLSQNKFGQYQILSELARKFHVPLISLEHTLPHPNWTTENLRQLKGMRGTTNIFISEYSRGKWGWSPAEADIVHHGVDTEVFRPLSLAKSPYVLSVANQFRTKERAWCIGFDFWQEAVHGLTWKHLGECPQGWSQPARDVDDLVRHYNETTVFCDTASFSPIPTVVLEAMSCGAIVCSRGNAMVPEVIKDGYNGFICPTPKLMRERLLDILNNPGNYTEIGENARKTIEEKFSLDHFIRNWDRVFRETADKTFRGTEF